MGGASAQAQALGAKITRMREMLSQNGPGSLSGKYGRDRLYGLLTGFFSVSGDKNSKEQKALVASGVCAVVALGIWQDKLRVQRYNPRLF